MTTDSETVKTSNSVTSVVEFWEEGSIGTWEKENESQIKKNKKIQALKININKNLQSIFEQKTTPPLRTHQEEAP